MIDRTISIRYARALSKICEENNMNSSGALEYLRHFASVIDENPAVSEFLKTNIVPMTKKIDIADKVLSGIGNFYIKNFLKKDIIDKLFAGDNNFYLKEFVKYMIRKNRYILFNEVLEIFEDIVNEKENRLKADVKSSVELSDSTKEELEKHLREKFNKSIDFVFSIDKSLIAGIVVKIDDIVYDGSAGTYLNNLERRLLKLPL